MEARQKEFTEAALEKGRKLPMWLATCSGCRRWRTFSCLPRTSRYHPHTDGNSTMHVW